VNSRRVGSACTAQQRAELCRGPDQGRSMLLGRCKAKKATPAEEERESNDQGRRDCRTLRHGPALNSCLSLRPTQQGQSHGMQVSADGMRGAARGYGARGRDTSEYRK